MVHSPDIGDCQPERVVSSHDDLQDRIARIADMDPNLLSHGLFHGDDSSSSNLLRRSIIEQPIIDLDTTQSDSVNHATCESDDYTNHQLSSLRLLEPGDCDELSQSPSEIEYRRHDSIAPWLPFYLRRTTSLLFLAIFVLMIAILESLFALSLRHSGLSAGTTSMRYLWSYGTTGILTLTAAFWHRLDYEEKVAAPWFKADPITSSKTALLVDYFDTWSLLVPFQAFRNKDYKVAHSSTVSLLLQLVIVLSTALFVLTPITSVNEAEPILLTSRFVDDPTRLRDSTSLLPYYITMKTELSSLLLGTNALNNPHSTYTEGLTDQFAYATFDTISPQFMEVKAIVDGLSMDLSCEPASMEKTVMMPRIVISSTNYTIGTRAGPYFTVKYQGCQTLIEWARFSRSYTSYTEFPQNDTTFRDHGMVLQSAPGFSRNQCNSTDKDSYRLIFVSAEVEWRSTRQNIVDDDGEQKILVNVNATISQGVALACTPSLNQVLLDVSRKSEGVQEVSPVSGETADFLKVIHPWDFVDFLFHERIILYSPYKDFEVNNTTVLADMYSDVVMGFCGQSCQTSAQLLNSKSLERFLTTFYSSYTAAAAQ